MYQQPTKLEIQAFKKANDDRFFRWARTTFGETVHRIELLICERYDEGSDNEYVHVVDDILGFDSENNVLTRQERSSVFEGAISVTLKEDTCTDE